MLACVYSPERLKQGEHGEAYALEFGVPIDPPRTAEEVLRWVLDNYDDRRDHIWEVELPEAITILSALVREFTADPPRLRAAALALGWLGKPRGNEVVEPLLDYPADDVKLAAIRSCGQMGVFATIPRIRGFLDSPDPRFRREAIIALGKYAKPEAIEDMERAAAGDPELLRLASEAKRRTVVSAAVLAHRVAMSRAAEMVLATDEYEDILAFIGFVWEYLAEIAADPAGDVVLRTRAVRLLGLGRIGKARNIARKIIVEAGDRDLKLAAVIAVGRMKGISSIGPLSEILDGVDYEMKLASINSLRLIGFPTALDKLLSHWDDRGGAFRVELRLAVRRCCPLGAYDLAAVMGTGGLGPYAEIHVIDDELHLFRRFNPDLTTALLEHPDSTARRDAILLFGLFGQPSDAVRLATIEELDPEPANRLLAAQARVRLRP